MSGADHSPNSPTAEDLYFTVQDNGLFVNTNVGAANPRPFWSNPLGADAHDVQVDSGNRSGQQWFVRWPRYTALSWRGRLCWRICNQQSRQLPTRWHSGWIHLQRCVCTLRTDQWVMVMSDCTAPNSLTDGLDNDGDTVIDNAGEFNGCSVPTVAMVAFT